MKRSGTKNACTYVKADPTHNTDTLQLLSVLVRHQVLVNQVYSNHRALLIGPS